MLSATNTPDKKAGSPNDSGKGLDTRVASTTSRALSFPKTNRLPDTRAYARVFAKANRSRDNLFTVLSRANGTDRARLGLAISKKQCRRACDRNRLKRLVRESFRKNAAELKGIDIVVLGQQGTSRADSPAIFDSLARHWQRTRSANPYPDPPFEGPSYESPQ